MAVYVSNYSSTQQRVSWDVPSDFAVTTGRAQIQRSINGGGYTTIPIDGKEWFHHSIRAVYITCSSGNSYRYRVRFRRTSPLGVEIYSDYYYSSTLTFQPPGGGYVPPDPTPPQPDPTPTRNPPTNLRITALADTSISLAWQNNQSYPYIILGTYVNGVVQDGRGWWTNNPTSFTDTLHPKPNRLLQYYILAEYAPGDYGYSNHVYIRTTPAAPPAATVEKYGAGIRVSWTRPTNWDKVWQWLDVQRWDNVSNQWATLLTGLSPDATSIEDYDIIRSRQYCYRVRARVNSGGFERVSAWATSAYIRLLSVYVNVGSWKNAATLSPCVGGSFKGIAGVWVNVGGVWRRN